jgi:hypothetical protein
MEMDFDRFREAASAGSASGGSNAPKPASGGLSDLESALDQIERAKEMERRLQEQVGPSLSDQVLKLAQDPKIQRAAREVWYGPEEAASAGPSAGPDGRPDRAERAEATPEVTPEVTEPLEPAVTEWDLDPIQSDLAAIDDYDKIDRIDVGQYVLEFGIATTHSGERRVTITDGDRVKQFPAEEFKEEFERVLEIDLEKRARKRHERKLQKLYEWIKEYSNTKEEAVVFTLVLDEINGEASVFDSMKEIAEFLDTSHNYVRKVKSEHSGPGRLTIGGQEFDEEVEIEVAL